MDGFDAPTGVLFAPCARNKSGSAESEHRRVGSAVHFVDVDASQILWIITNEISPLKKAICFFIEQLKKS